MKNPSARSRILLTVAISIISFLSLTGVVLRADSWSSPKANRTAPVAEIPEPTPVYLKPENETPELLERIRRQHEAVNPVAWAIQTATGVPVEETEIAHGVFARMEGEKYDAFTVVWRLAPGVDTDAVKVFRSPAAARMRVSDPEIVGTNAKMAGGWLAPDSDGVSALPSSGLKNKADGEWTEIKAEVIVPFTNFSVTNTNDSGTGSLRQALTSANADSSGPHVITISATGTINLLSALPQINNISVTINGPGATNLTINRSSSGSYSIFETPNVLFTQSYGFSGMRIQNGSSSFSGGGLNITGGSLTISQCAIVNNVGASSGGGLAVVFVNPATISNTTFSGNSTGFQGSAINAQAAVMNITNCTFSGNQISGTNGSGGGIFHFSNATALALTNCTFSGNTSNSTAFGGGAALVAQNPGTYRNTIFSGQSPQISGSGASSLGNNLCSDGTGTLTGTGDLPNTNPLLAALGSNGGQTQTCALLPGSPAINAGTATSAPTSDQRGIARVGTTDIGSFESRGFTMTRGTGNNQTTAPGTAFATPLTVTVASANSEPVDGGQVTFTPPGSGASATVAGNPATIASGSATSGTVTANTTAGGPYNVAASARGVTTGVNFSLTNACPTITAFTVTGGGSFCSGGSGVAVGLSDTEVGVNYQLFRGASPVGSPVAGTGSAISFGNQTTAGTYTVVGTFGTTICTANMTGNAVVTVNTLPTVFNVTGGGGVCAGGPGVAVGLSGSQSGVNYQLFNGASPVGSPVAGTGSAISFGNQTTAGTYTVVATNGTTSCTANMTGSATVTVIGDQLVTNGSDSGAGSLRQAIADACPGSTITFQAGVTTVTLTTAELAINKNLTINGGTGVTVTRQGGSPNFRIFNVLSGNTVSMNNLTVTNGSAPVQAGGIQNSGTLTLTNCAISGNTAPQSGGIQNDNILTMTGCTVSSNSGTTFGGGLIIAGSTTTLTNCTISGNIGGSDSGGIGAAGTVSLTNCTIANNQVTSTGGGITVNTANVTLRNTIFAQNTAPISPNIDGTVNAASSNNLIGVGGTGGLTNGVNGNLVGVATPLLGTLGSNGGPTQTIALLPGSPAINAGTNTSAPSTDQRGIARPQQTTTDIGAFESRGFTMTLSGGNNQSAPVNTAFASPLAVTVSSAFSEPVNGGRVTFTPPGSGASATIAGNPATIASGTATTGTVTANGTLGGPYTVAASANGVPTGVNFSLTNGCPTITAFNVTGGGNICAGNSAVVGLSGSQTGVNYQLFNGASPVGSPVAGTGSAISFGNQTAAGTYTVVATNAATGCTANMTGSATVTVNPLPTLFTVTGGGSFCAGGSGVAVGLSSSQTGVSYQLFRGASPVGNPVVGTGSAISFGSQTTAGTYTVLATNTVTACMSTMTGSAVVTVNALPTVFNVTGGGVVCGGGPGVAVGLSGSQSGVNYQLFNGASPVGSPVAGTGSAISFGNQTTVGTYTVVATNTTTGCTSNMTGSAVVTANSLVVTNGNDSGAGSLRDVLATACAGSTITFQTGVTTVTLTTAELSVGASVTINGGTGVTVTRGAGSPNFRIFNILSGNTVSMNNLTVTNGNGTGDGGGILSNGALTLTNCTISGNTASNRGGGLFVLNASATLTGCTINGNTSTNFGAGAFQSTSVTLTNCTVSGNTGSVGGLAFDNSSPATLTNCSVANNSSFGIVVVSSSRATSLVTLVNTMVLDTINGFVSLTSFNNLVQGIPGLGAAGGLVDGTDGNLVNVANPRVGTLGNYGGATQTLALLPGSPAINAGTATGAPTTDQRGIARVGNVDIGAFESRGFTMALSGGNNQSAPIGANFASPLAVTVASAFGEPVDGGGVTFTSPGSGASASVAGNPATIASGTATTGTVTANGTPGGPYVVAASANGVATGVNFSLTNACPTITAFSVTGGGSFCSGGTGVAVGLSGSQTGVSYQLFNGASPVGSPVAGTGSALNFGNQTTAGTYTVVGAFGATGCTANMTGSATVTVNALPTAFNVTGGGSFCSGGTGVAVGLSGSQTGVNYQLFNGASPVGSPVAGTGSAISFGNQTTAGTYTVVATATTGSCTSNMTGSAVVTVNALPAIFNVTGGGGTSCVGGSGVAVGLSGSETGVNYQLFNGATPLGSPVAGTGSALNFGNQTTAGTYTVVATNSTTGCTSNMSGNAVVTVVSAPTAFNVTGGGSFCAGGTGVAVGLSGSETGVNYQLFRGASPVGSPVAGTGSALSLGIQTTAGTYTVVGTNATAGCSTNMTGSAVVTVNPTPSIFNVTGGGSFCTGGTGVAVGLSGSQTGVNYQLFNGASPVGSPVAGTGSALNFGNQTTAGTYTVVATNGTTGCTSNMSGSAVVTVTTCQPTVTTNPATGVSSTGATLNGTVTANGDSTTVLFRYGTTAGGPYPNVIAATPSPVTGTTPTTVSATLTGLATNQIYYFVVEGSNVSGTSQGAEQSFSTATCSFQLSASSANFPASGGNGSVTLTTTTGCVWTVSGLPDWIINVSPANGTGTTAITYTVNPNLSQNPRSATLTIGGQSYTVNQDPSVQVNGSIGLAITGQTVLPTSCGPNYANDYVITATLTNTGSQPIYNPYLRVLELQEAAGSPAPPVPFRLITADGATCGTGGLVGSIQSTDGQTTPATLPTLAPGQSVTVRLVIALPSLRRFRFIFGVDGSFTAPVAMKGRASKAGFAKTFTLARQIEPSTGTAFVFIPSADGKTMNIVPVQPELEAFLNLGDNFWAGLNQARLASSTKHP